MLGCFAGGFSSPGLSPPRAPEAWRRTFSDARTGHRISTNPSSLELSSENIYIPTTTKKRWRKRSLCLISLLGSWAEEKGLPGKHRETCPCGAEVRLQKAESGERHLQQTQKGDQSQASGARAELEPGSRRRWLGVRCWHCHPAQAAQHETVLLLASDIATMPWLTPAPKRCGEGFCFSCRQLPHKHAFQPESSHKLLKGAVTGEVERNVPFAPHPLYLPKEHWHLLV